MSLLLLKFGFLSRLPINKWFFSTSRLPLEASLVWMKERDVLTVTDTRTICCLISSRAHALNLVKSLWYLKVSTLHNSRSIRSLAPRSCSTHRSTLLRVLQYENLRGRYLKQFSWWFQWARWDFLNSCRDQHWFIFCNGIKNYSNKCYLVLPKPLGIQTRIWAEKMLNWKRY